MTHGSLPPLSPKTQALLAGEREIVAQPAAVRRRALLRARAAMWHTRDLGADTSRLNGKNAVRATAVAVLVATSAAAAWITISPAASVESNARKAAPEVSEPPPAPPRELARPLPRVTVPEPAEPEPGESVAPAAPAAKRQVPPKRATANHETPGGAPEELRLLDKARRALVAGDFRAALGFIHRHQSVFPNGQLSEEREALRIQALRGAGKSKQAGRAASDFESRYPNSVLAPELSKDSR